MEGMQHAGMKRRNHPPDDLRQARIVGIRRGLGTTMIPVHM